jgi:hypothetical protein
LLGKEIQVQQTPGFISSLVIKLAVDKDVFTHKHYNSVQLPPLGGMQTAMIHTGEHYLNCKHRESTANEVHSLTNTTDTTHHK